MSNVYRVHEFAALAGVSVRTLHHYDRLSLLKPQRTHAGYRLYTAHDLERLEQVLALKFLGLPLTQIKTILDQNSLRLSDSLPLQRAALEEKRLLLDSAISAIKNAEDMILRDHPPDAKVLSAIITAFKQVNSLEFMEKYFSPEAWTKYSLRQKRLSREAKLHASQAWVDLYREADALLSEDPAGEKAQDLAARWLALADASAAGDKGIKAGFTKAWKNNRDWPAKDRQRIAQFNLEKIAEFISLAIAGSLKKFYSEAAWAKVVKLRNQSDAESRRQIWQAWLALFRDVDAALDEHPTGKTAQELATRWMKLIEKSTSDDPGVNAGMRKAWQNRQAWPASLQEQLAPFRLDKISQFIQKALALRRI